LDEYWYNYLTAIRFTNEDPIVIKTRQPEDITLSEFKIVDWALGIDKWDDVRNCLSASKLEFDGNEILLGQPTEVGSISCNLSPGSSYFLDSNWSYYDGDYPRRPPSMPDPELWRRSEAEFRALGFRDSYQAIGESLGIQLSQSVNARSEIIVGAPVYAKTSSVSFDGQTVLVRLTIHEKLSNAKLIVDLMRGREYGLTAGQKKNGFVKELNSCEFTKTDQFRNITLKHSFADVDLTGALEMRLIRGSLPLENQVFQVPSLLREHPSVLYGTDFPLAKVLDRFCGFDDLSKHVLSPESIKNAAKIFERGLAWLLAISGLFIVIKLDEYDNLKIRETKFDLGAVDLLAYSIHSGEILLVSCKTNIPDDTKIAEIKQCASRLVKEGVLSGSTKFIPLLATPRDVPQSVIETGKKDGVRIIDAEDLKTLLDCVQVGNAEKLCQFWGVNPRSSKAREKV
jgi:hypothetical protein